MKVKPLHILLVLLCIVSIVILVQYTTTYNVPHFIPKQDTSGPSIINGVPLVLYQSWGTHTLPRGMVNNLHTVLDSNPQFDYYLFSDEECRMYIKDNFPTEVVEAFDSLRPGAYKSDLWRYCILYKKGGVYMDIKCKPLIPVTQLIEIQPIVLVKDHINQERLTECVWNGFMIAPPGFPVFLECINDIVKNCRAKDYRRNTLDITGPCCLGRIIKQHANDKFLSYNILALSGEYIFHNTKPIIQMQYTGYRQEQKMCARSEHYSKMYHERRVFA